MSDREEIAAALLALPLEERVRLFDQLEQSLLYGGCETPELAAAWAKEIERRIEQIERGEVQTVDFKTALESIRQSLDEQRSQGG